MANSKQFIGYIGTYTNGESQGIYRFTLDTDKPKITDVELAGTIDNPTYLAISEDNKYLYSVIKEGTSGGVASFLIDAETNDLKPINHELLEGAAPCYVGINKENSHLLSSNYHKGTVGLYLVKDDGSISPAVSIVRHEGSGHYEERQEAPHIHYSAFTPDQKFVVVVDLGTDQLVTYKIEKNTLKTVHTLDFSPASGVRHLVFHPTKPYAYVMTELTSEVVSLKFNAEDGRFSIIEYQSTLPEGYKETSSGSAIHITRDGRFVYTATRGHDSIGVFEVDDKTGKLTLVEITSTEGKGPRDFSLDPTEKFLIAANQNSNNLVLFIRDEETGKLTLVDGEPEVHDPVCVKFLNV
ncbi:lactonase family protein [Terrilactibacillus laevilacticus]|uniref:Lactonase family protein n=1 Tax=Terrilactibacillus laevilacticus TaxID=1380157 RepID=A0ABW5PQV6_9BACI|nr:lactonase family protein [Terrilactibacillus laevilacticus]